jgi:Fe-S-cluster containining protein
MGRKSRAKPIRKPPVPAQTPEAQALVERFRQAAMQAKNNLWPDASLLESVTMLTASHQAAASAEILSEGHGPATARELARNALGFAERMCHDLTPQLHPPHRPVCRAGCHWCCAMPVVVRPWEALYIARRLQEQLTREQMEACLADLRQRVATPVVPNTRWCAFLNAEGMCAIYQVRPLMCRGYTSSSADECEQAYHNVIEEQTHVGITLQMLASRIGQGVDEATEAYHLESGLYELESAVLRALETPDAAGRWAKGERVFTGCHPVDVPDQARQVMRDSLLQLGIFTKEKGGDPIA